MQTSLQIYVKRCEFYRVPLAKIARKSLRVSKFIKSAPLFLFRTFSRRYCRRVNLWTARSSPTIIHIFFIIMRHDTLFIRKYYVLSQITSELKNHRESTKRRLGGFNKSLVAYSWSQQFVITSFLKVFVCLAALCKCE